MKIAVTSRGDSMSSDVDPRFGRAQYFIIYDTEQGDARAVGNSMNVELPQGAGIQAAEMIVREGADVLLTGHCGPKAFRTLSAADVKVITGAEGTVQEAIEKFQRGELKEASAPDVEGHWS